MSRGRRSKYNPAAVDAIVKAYEAGGNDTNAAEAVQVNIGTLYNWLAKYPELKERCDRAKEKSVADASVPIIDRLKQCEELAEDYVSRLLKGEVFKTKTRTDGSGNLLWTEKEQVHPSDRILERFMPKSENDDVTFNLTIGLAEPDNEEPPLESE